VEIIKKENMPDTTETPSFKEDHISQVPALQLLVKLGYKYLTPEEALAARGGRLNGVILESVLAEQLRKINIIKFKGGEYPFSESNILSAIQSLKEYTYDGLIRTNEKIYDLLCLGKSLTQAIEGDAKSFQLNYIDWKTSGKNIFHVTEEFSVERSGSHETRRPDIVLFVNGIPLAVIECKRPDIKEPMVQGVSQQIGYQHEDEIPKLYVYAQLLLVIAKNKSKYSTVGSPAKFWAVWKEQQDNEAELQTIIKTPLSHEEHNKLFSNRFKYVREYFERLDGVGRQTYEQDRVLYALCRPERLLELAFRFTLFDSGEKKVARYQQYFCVKKILARIREIRDGKRQGGVVWHTQGSGKSLTMVMLAQAIALEPGITDYKIVLVTDRIDLDDQIYRTFAHCGVEPEQAKTGKDLADMLEGHKQRIVTTVIDKFEAAVGKAGLCNKDHNIFVLVDESHRSQYGPLHAKMRKALPNACFIGFTGTPVVKKDRDTIHRFGGLIDTYTITQAVEDKAVVPLLYEGRHVDQKVDSESIDAWFERITTGLSAQQKVDLKKKFSTTDQLNKAQQKVMRIAWDISVHYRDNWQGTPYKAQLVTQDKAAALLYKKFIEEFGIVSAEVLVSGPDEREGEDDPSAESSDVMKVFWKKMMVKYGNEKEYNRQLIHAFKNAEQPEIIIVVDKLLTGFDAPRNTVLYLTRKLDGHTLLQAIARVNRLYDGKDFGYILDYRGVLQNLDLALDVYATLADLDDEGLRDLAETLKDVEVEIQKLPQLYSDLWDIFKTVQNKRDAEEYERLLGDEPLRAKFYERLSSFSRSLAIAMSSVKFLETTANNKIEKYKNDLKFFMNLRASVGKRYSEVVDFKEYEVKIQKLIDTHVGTGEVEKITGLVNIFDSEAFAKEVEKAGGTASKADTIAYRTKKTIHEKMDEDPAFYKRFSELLEAAIRAFREQRISDNEYLSQVRDITDKVRTRTGDEVPVSIQNNNNAKAFYGVVRETLAKYTIAEKNNGVGAAADSGQKYEAGKGDIKEISARAAMAVDEIIKDSRIVNWVNNPDIQNKMKGEIEDYLFELKEAEGLDLSFDDMDIIMEACLDVARVRYAL
jgi:type I restriction enzyme R subunit